MSLLRRIGEGLSGGPGDRALVSRFLQDRDERAFRHLYRRYAPALAQMVLRFVGGNTGDVEDVLQITWVRAIEGLPGFRWESTLRSWLTGIAINCSREHQRRSIRDRKSTTTLEDARDFTNRVGTGPELSADARVSRIDLERAISDLPDRYREVLVLHDIEGYTHREISGFLGIESGTSKSQLSRARAAVRAMLSRAETGLYNHD